MHSSKKIKVKVFKDQKCKFIFDSDEYEKDKNKNEEYGFPVIKSPSDIWEHISSGTELMLMRRPYEDKWQVNSF